MKTILKIIIVLAALVAVFGLALYFLEPSPEKTTTNNPTTQKPPVVASSLTVVDNAVQIKKLSDGQFKDVAGANASVEEGTQVKTSLTGRAIIESPNQTTVVVDKNSEFTITQSEENKTKLSLISGNLWAKVEKLFGKGEYFQVETPNSVATVRGTSFGVFYKNGATIVMVAKSKVALLSIDPVTKKPIGDEVIINENYKGVITNGSVPAVESISASDKKMDWYIFNGPNQTNTNTKPNISAPIGDKIQSGSAASPTANQQPTTTTTTTTTPDTASAPSQGTAVPQASTITQSPPANQPAPSPVAKSEIYSVTPNTVYVSQGANDFSINGQSLDQVRAVYLNSIAINFVIKDPQTIIATAVQEITPGVYDVSVEFSNGNKLTLYKALSIR